MKSQVLTDSFWQGHVVIAIALLDSAMPELDACL
jgi:hypothetical protein